MSFTFRPAKRENTPLIIGLAGPTKSGKTYSAHRLAVGLANGGPVAMINAEGAKGHQYSDRFTYLTADITAPFRPERYTEVLKDALALTPTPAVVIIDSASHMHDGPGGLLEYHEDELDRLAGSDMKARLRSTWSAWVKPKAAENAFIYTMLAADCHLILCFRAKEKIKVVKGGDPIDLGWQPIAGDRVSFETIFTLVLPPRSKGVPDLAISDMREPFDQIVPAGQPLSEETGRKLAEWAAGGKVAVSVGGVEGARSESAAQALVQAENGTAGQEGGLTAGAVATMEEEPVEFDEDTTEARAQRYIARKQGARAAQPRGQRRQPTLRAFDTPEDLAYQDVGEEQDEKESGPLMQNDGSITASQR